MSVDPSLLVFWAMVLQFDSHRLTPQQPSIPLALSMQAHSQRSKILALAAARKSKTNRLLMMVFLFVQICLKLLLLSPVIGKNAQLKMMWLPRLAFASKWKRKKKQSCTNKAYRSSKKRSPKFVKVLDQRTQIRTREGLGKNRNTSNGGFRVLKKIQLNKQNTLFGLKQIPEFWKVSCLFLLKKRSNQGHKVFHIY